MASEEPVEDMFAGLKKKKKSKKVVFDEEAEVATPVAAAPVVSTKVDAPLKPTPSAAAEPSPEPPAADDGDLDFSDLKKKKKKKSVRIVSDDEGDSAPTPKASKTDALGNAIEDDEAPAAQTAQAAADDDVEDFSSLKKKKKSKKAAFDLEAFEKELQEAEDAKAGSDEDGPSGPADDEDVEGEDPFGNEEGTQSKAEKAAEAKAWLKEGDRDYEYIELLGRFYSQLYISHPSLSASGTKRKYTLAPPQMFREGSKRSVFANVVDISKKMNRQPEHVIQFLFAELGTTGSVDANGQLVIKGRFQQKQMEIVLRRYITEYVACKTCKSPDTKLTKDNRLFFMTCDSCGSTRSVQAIKTGFAAQIGKRRAQKTG